MPWSSKRNEYDRFSVRVPFTYLLEIIDSCHIDITSVIQRMGYES